MGASLKRFIVKIHCTLWLDVGVNIHDGKDDKDKKEYFELLAS